jgi:hypothetical protein
VSPVSVSTLATITVSVRTPSRPTPPSPPSSSTLMRSWSPNGSAVSVTVADSRSAKTSSMSPRWASATWPAVTTG